MTLHHGDCLEVMPTLPEASVDAVVTDPPYGLEFMGREWDRLHVDRRQPGDATFHKSGAGPFDRATVRHGYGTFGPAMQAWHEAWATAALRVTKPGGYLLAFGGTRTHHRLVCALEDAGWIIRDELTWIHAQGFPKGKANLKPAHEPIVLARKPGPLRPLEIDAGRIPTGDDLNGGAYSAAKSNDGEWGTLHRYAGKDFEQPAGRWPSNVLLSDPELFDQPNPYVVGSGAVSASGDAHVLRRGGTTGSGMGYGSSAAGDVLDATYGDTGGYSRFFLVPKADRAEREPVLRGETAYCSCETAKLSTWDSEGRSRSAPTDSTSRARATSEATSAGGFDWPTSPNGNDTSDPSHLDSRSTTSTATSSTTASPTSSSSIPSLTSDSTRAAKSSTASGGSGAPSANSTGRSLRNGGTSVERAGPSTPAVPATSARWSSASNVCDNCGKPRTDWPIGGGLGVTPDGRAARRNSHPT